MLPAIDYDRVEREIALLLTAYAGNLVLAAHDISDGGALVALAKMAFATAGGARIGMRLNESPLDGREGTGAFTETCGFIVEVTDAARFEALGQKPTAQMHCESARQRRPTRSSSPAAVERVRSTCSTKCVVRAAARFLRALRASVAGAAVMARVAVVVFPGPTAWLKRTVRCSLRRASMREIVHWSVWFMRYCAFRRSLRAAGRLCLRRSRARRRRRRARCKVMDAVIDRRALRQVGHRDRQRRAGAARSGACARHRSAAPPDRRFRAEHEREVHVGVMSMRQACRVAHARSAAGRFADGAVRCRHGRRGW